jgi:hypothetical protein
VFCAKRPRAASTVPDHVDVVRPAIPIAKEEPVENNRNGETIDCPQCASQDVAWLAFMRRYHRLRDWFRCESCGHFFCTPKQNAWRSALTTIRGSGHGGREVA